ncbi:phosphatidyl synthase [Aspergillus eucalypticola CBS 122712]|uniref:Phosphatidyl synthase n=1 Tax=Aspergillus eucalypticola (strain CBS 122712 / IBT 29274) TaxID=1448314 RepID=A0A317W3A3_ASPEC|nr:phosphatidyl synthase [Aspergillus eucalypticola CBS 122712]PWY78670.1 phosphatidyl synthase [Aspergillus eucalypticola CBS 122712]
MTAIAMFPMPLRVSRQCARLFASPLVNTPLSQRGWQMSVTEARSFSAITLGSRSRTQANTLRKKVGLCAIESQLVRSVGQQKRYSAQKPTDSDSSSLKKSPILSKLPRTHENIYTVPNILTFTRLLAAPMVGYFLVHDHHVAALGLFAYAGITDLVDGYIARRWNLQTVVGTIIDPMADKLLMTIGVTCLAVNGSIPVWLAVIILGRDVGLAISAIYYRWISLPPPKTMARYWDFSLPSAEVKPTTVSKINTALQLLLVGSAIALPVLPETVIDAWSLREAMTGFQYLVAATTLWSGLSYVFSRDAVKILSKEEVQKRIARAAAGKKP